MSTYSIKDLEVISGIKAHTIRIWEQRYGLLVPQRTDTNIRYYDDAQMRRLLNVTTLIENGEKVSRVATYTLEEIHARVTKLIEDATKVDAQSNALINKIISAGLTFDEKSFNHAFHLAVKTHGLLGAFLEVIYPMLVRVGLMWTKQDLIPSQEHFISNLIKQKLFSAIEDIDDQTNLQSEKWVLFLPEDEDHEIGLLLSSYLLKSYGKKVILLGQRVPYSSLESIVKTEEPHAMHFFMIRNHSEKKVQRIIDNIGPMTQNIQVYVSGANHLENCVEIPKNFNFVNSIEKFLEVIQPSK